jgi:hypothetical protein
MTKMNLYKFERPGEDVCNEKGKIISFKAVNVAAESMEAAVEKAKLSDEYKFIELRELSDYWSTKRV